MASVGNITLYSLYYPCILSTFYNALIFLLASTTTQTGNTANILLTVNFRPGQSQTKSTDNLPAKPMT